jgi:hypothetical protein
MSRIREAYRRRMDVFRRELRREDAEVRDEREGNVDPAPDPHGPEVEDLPLGVPPKPAKDRDVELPGFPPGDPTHG